MAILDWTIGPTYIMTLLACQHEQKVGKDPQLTELHIG